MKDFKACKESGEIKQVVIDESNDIFLRFWIVLAV